VNDREQDVILVSSVTNRRMLMTWPQPFRGKIYDDISQTIGHTPLVL
jgi:hypothetical protein